MKHFLKTKSIEFVNLKNKEIRNKEVLNLIKEQDAIELGTQVVIDISVSGDYILEAIEIDGNDVWWEIKGGIQND